MQRSHSTVMTTTAWVVAGVLLALYPATRPWEDETTLPGVVSWDSARWQLSHTAAILGLIALVTASGLRAWATRSGAAVPILIGAGTALVLPYYGAEAYGLPMIGELSRRQDDASLGDLAESFRYGAAPLTLFSIGLFLLAAAGFILLVRQREVGGRLGATLLGIWLVTFLPQFFLGAPLRVAHGVLALCACLLLGASAIRRPALSRHA